MINNSLFGFSIQKSICERFNLRPISLRASHIFDVNYDKSIAEYSSIVLDDIFNNINIVPIKCTTMLEINGVECPYNFVLSNDLTLSVRTNINGDKIAPREIGQAGYAKLNKYFKNISGSDIRTQSDIKELFIKHVDEVLPIFVDKLFDADYTLWIQISNSGVYDYYLLDKSKIKEIMFEKGKFSFSRGYDDWIESSTLRYNGEPIAEIQIHKNRNFKFRFKMKKIIKLFPAIVIFKRTKE